jgi:hypothetical protein
MRRGPSGSTIAIAMALVLVLVVGILLRWRVRSVTARRTESSQADSIHAARATPPTPGAADAGAGDLANDDPFEGDPFGAPDDPARAWASVDLDAIRKALPDSTYWKMAAPTKDPEVLRQREEERDRWNVEYGKVLSNTATAEEIDAYYAQRQRLSEDYLEFIVYLLTNYGYQIPERDVAALKLAAEMHHERLEEIPRRIVEAQQRREAHEAARRAWREQQKDFGDDAVSSPPPPRAACSIVSAMSATACGPAFSSF